MSSDAGERKFEALVAVDSDAHTSDELSSMLSMDPDERWDRGESFTFAGRERQRNFSRWALVERDGDIEDWRSTVERLIDRLRGVSAAFRGLPPGVRVALILFVTEDNGVFGFGLDAHQVEFLSTIGAELDMSFVVSSNAPP
ncbi:MAG: DUF4279 domain-containing protein [Labilithrix sp.]|nr:DUF4279 domain-containing protein [Labilithrix sp.]